MKITAPFCLTYVRLYCGENGVLFKTHFDAISPYISLNSSQSEYTFLHLKRISFIKNDCF